MLAAYQRIGQTLSPLKIQNILSANQGSSGWKKLKRDSLESQTFIIGCYYQLADGF